MFRGITLLTALIAAVGLPRAQSIAASLSGYGASLRISSVAGVSAKSFSGAAFHPDTRTLYVIDNDNAVIYELSTAGVLLRSIATSGFQDPEGIVYQSNDYFLISEEGLGNIVRIRLPRTGNGPVPKSGGVTLNLAQNLANSGIEGVGYRSSDNTAYAVNETAPSRLYRITLDADGAPNASFPDDPFDIGSKSGDAADIYASNDGDFILVNQEQNKLEGYGTKGQALSSLSLGMAKPEGIAVDTSTGTIYVVGEPQELCVFRKANTGARNARPEDNPFHCSLIPGGPAGAGPTLSYFLPQETGIRIETASIDGTWFLAFAGRMPQGSHAFEINQSAASGAHTASGRNDLLPFHSRSAPACISIPDDLRGKIDFRLPDHRVPFRCQTEAFRILHEPVESLPIRDPQDLDFIWKIRQAFIWCAFGRVGNHNLPAVPPENIQGLLLISQELPTDSVFPIQLNGRVQHGFSRKTDRRASRF